MTSVAIIGAGLAGLTAAHELSKHTEVTIFEKARGVGGRMATRRASPYAFDHGAQYFTARSEPFRKFLSPLIKNGLVSNWSATHAEFEGTHLVRKRRWDQGESHYVAVPGMNALAKHFAPHSVIKTSTRIVKLNQDRGWCLTDENGQSWTDFDWVISTLPAPQAATLLPFDFASLDLVKQIEMLPCFAVLLGFSQPLRLRFQAAHFTQSDLSWMAVDGNKPGRNNANTLVLHSSHDYAAIHLDEEPHVIISHLMAEFAQATGCILPKPDHSAVHRWLYANNKERKELPLLLDSRRRIGACGDWTAGGRVEGAFLSAYRLSHALLKAIG